MIIQERGWPTYLQGKITTIRLWHQRLGYASNARIIQASKLVDRIDLDKEKPTNTYKKQDSNSEPENDKNIDSDVDKLVPIYKGIDVNDEMELYDTCIESKHTRIVKSIWMISII